MKKYIAIILAGLAVFTAGPFRNTVHAQEAAPAAASAAASIANVPAATAAAPTATTNAPAAVPADGSNIGLTAIAPDWANSIANALAGVSPTVAKIVGWVACLMVALRFIFKPVCSFAYRNDPTPSDTEWAQTVADHTWLKTVAFILDIGASIKITHPAA